MTQAYNIAELFARNPRELSDDEFRTIINELREKRQRFLADENKPKAPRRTAAPKKKDALASVDIDIKL